MRLAGRSTYIVVTLRHHLYPSSNRARTVAAAQSVIMSHACLSKHARPYTKLDPPPDSRWKSPSQPPRGQPGMGGGLQALQSRASKSPLADSPLPFNRPTSHSSHSHQPTRTNHPWRIWQPVRKHSENPSPLPTDQSS